MHDVVEILFETLEETNERPPESLGKEKNLSTVWDVVEIYSKALKETIVRVLFLSQETSLRSRRLKQKSPFDLKVTSFISRRNI